MARTYYISTFGNDANDGLSTSTPWRTVSKVLGWSQLPGDTYAFHTGEVFDSAVFAPLVSGASGAPIVFTSYGTQSAPVINASAYDGTLNVGGPGRGPGLRIKNVAHVEVRGLHFKGPGVDSGTGATNSGLDPNSVVPQLNNEVGVGADVFSDTATGTPYLGVVVDSCEIDGFYQAFFIHAEPLSGNPDCFNASAFTNNTVHDCVNNGIYLWGGNPASQDAVSPLRQSGRSWGGYHGFFFQNVTISGNQVYNIFGDPDQTLGGGGGIIANNLDGGSVAGTYGCVVASNVVQDCGALLAQNTGALSGGSTAFAFTDSRGALMEKNEAYNQKVATGQGFDACGFDLDLHCVNCAVRGNLSHDNDGPGYQSSDVLTSRPSSGNLFHDNVSVNDCRNPHATRALGGFMAYGGGFTAYHNTIVVPNLAAATGAAGSHFPACVTVMQGGVPPAGKLINNILLADGTTRLLSPNDSSAFGVVLNGNQWYSDTGAPIWQFSTSGPTYTSLAALHALGEGYEVEGGVLVGHYGDPLLRTGTAPANELPGSVVAAYAGVDPLAGSPVLGAALSLTPFGITPGAVDFRGTLYAAAALNIGAVQLAGTTASNPATQIMTAISVPPGTAPDGWELDTEGALIATVTVVNSFTALVAAKAGVSPRAMGQVRARWSNTARGGPVVYSNWATFTVGPQGA